MTGQGAAHILHHATRVAAELRTVNNRYYKLALRISDGYSSLEPRIDELVRRFVRRGTVQLDVRIERQSTAEDYRLNEVALGSYLKQIQQLQKTLKMEGEIRLESFLSLPGIVNEDAAAQQDVDEHWPAIERAVTQALESLTRMRQDEGAAMAADLADNIRLILDELAKIDVLAPRVVEGYRQRLTDKIKKLTSELGVAAEAADVVREVGLFAERTDISEENVRLRSHLDQFATVMRTAESNGRKLDFITQEMFREANTIGSKANDAQIAIHVVEIKTSIERIREMIQNVE
jgi:uncharacterized protein (TIGR00255 family)